MNRRSFLAALAAAIVAPRILERISAVEPLPVWAQIPAGRDAFVSVMDFPYSSETLHALSPAATAAWNSANYSSGPPLSVEQLRRLKHAIANVHIQPACWRARAPEWDIFEEVS